MTVEDPRQVLSSFFGFRDFRGDQESIINAAMSGRDGIAIMATGGGKSLCYQIPALSRRGTTLVISPLIALMEDQVQALQARGARATFLHSGLDMTEQAARLDRVAKGEYSLVYMSPESLSSERVMASLAAAGISMAAVDEAHCVSTWGHDFRPAFKTVRSSLDKIEYHQGFRVQRFAYTATATEDIKKDIIHQLGLNDPFEYTGSFDRANIEINVRNSINKNDDLVETLRVGNGEPTIVYCSTIKAIKNVSAILRREGLAHVCYHGKMEGHERSERQKEFVQGGSTIMVATNAFGMGVDKSDIRHVVNYDMPKSIEDYYQQIGRAGRDGLPSRATMLYNRNDRRLHDFFLQMNFPDPEVVRGVASVVFAFNDGMPVSLSQARIAELAPNKVDERDVPGALRFLQDAGLIKERSYELSSTDPVIEVLSECRELDFSDYNTRKKVIAQNLNQIIRFSETSLCRRAYILEYFQGSRPIEHCGSCDSCLDNEAGIGLEGDSRRYYSNEAGKSLLQSIQDFPKPPRPNDACQVLMGSKSRLMERAGRYEILGYGSMREWTKTAVSVLLNAAVSEGYVEQEKGALTLTEKARDSLRNNQRILIPAPKGVVANTLVNSGETKPKMKQTGSAVDVDLYAALISKREDLSFKHTLPKFMVASDQVIKQIATIRPNSKEGLVECGLSQRNANHFGDHFVAVLEERSVDDPCP